MPPTSRRAPAVAALLAVLLWAGAASAYTIYLKDGSTVVAQDKYTLRDGRALITLPNGTHTFIPASQIDVARTEAANKSNLGSAVVLEGETPDSKAPPPAPPRKTLGDLIRERPAQPPAAPAPAPAPAPGGTTEPATPETRASATGPRRLLDSPVADELVAIFREHGIEGIQVLHGGEAGRPRVEASTPSESAVFRTLAVAASALAQVRAGGAETPALELVMTTPTGERAGRFLLTPDIADDLLAGSVDIATFFVAHVDF